MLKTVLVTGGLGFIGKHFIKCLLSNGNYYVINVDKISYASDPKINTLFNPIQYKFIKAKVEELETIPEIDYIVNFAAESHVDNSFSNNEKFCTSNILSVHRLLELLREKEKLARPKFVHISTDEVYGDIESGKFTENSPLKPSNPYSATKAAAEMLIIAWGRTYNLDYNIVRMSNVYGPHQYPEKLIPKTILRLKKGLPALIHGDGSYIRTWLNVQDASLAILTVMTRGKWQEVYNIPGNIELSNLEVYEKIANIIKKTSYTTPTFKLTDNRVTQDVRYALDGKKIHELGWEPILDFDISLEYLIQNFEDLRFL